MKLFLTSLLSCTSLSREAFYRQHVGDAEYFEVADNQHPERSSHEQILNFIDYLCVFRLIKTLSNVDGKISNIEQSLRDFSNSYRHRGMRGGVQRRMHYPNESNSHNTSVVESYSQNDNVTSHKENNDEKFNWDENGNGLGLGPDLASKYGKEHYEEITEASKFPTEMEDHHYDHEYSDDSRAEEGTQEDHNSSSSTNSKIQDSNEDDEQVTETELKELKSNRDSFINYGYDDTTMFSYQQHNREG